MPVDKPKGKTAEEQAAHLNYLKRNYLPIEEASAIPETKLHDIVDNVNYMSTQLLADVQVGDKKRK